jgi:hypothetical protein
MSKLSISQALKEKNRIAGRIVKLQAQLKNLNRMEEGKPRDFEPGDIYLKLQEEWAYLVDIKTRLAAANVGIAAALIKLTEAKASLAYWNGFTNAGPAKEIVSKSVRRGNEYVEEDFIYVSYISSKEVVELQESCQKYIEALQDEIDAYNATTRI